MFYQRHKIVVSCICLFIFQERLSANFEQDSPCKEEIIEVIPVKSPRVDDIYDTFEKIARYCVKDPYKARALLLSNRSVSATVKKLLKEKRIAAVFSKSSEMNTIEAFSALVTSPLWFSILLDPVFRSYRNQTPALPSRLEGRYEAKFNFKSLRMIFANRNKSAQYKVDVNDVISLFLLQKICIPFVVNHSLAHIRKEHGELEPNIYSKVKGFVESVSLEQSGRLYLNYFPASSAYPDLSLLEDPTSQIAGKIVAHFNAVNAEIDRSIQQILSNYLPKPNYKCTHICKTIVAICAILSHVSLTYYLVSDQFQADVTDLIKESIGSPMRQKRARLSDHNLVSNSVKKRPLSLE